MKLFYSDPLKAAWMAREFGVKFGIKHHGKLVWDWMDIMNVPHPARTAEDILEDYPNQSYKELYVHPDSYAIFEPKVGDIILDNDNEPRRLCKIVQDRLMWHEDEDYGYCYRINMRGIILRNGKQFFPPETE